MRSNDPFGPASQIARGVDALAELDWQAIAARERLSALAELERLQRRITAVSHTVIDALSRDDVTVLGDRPAKVIADRLRISLAEARCRIKDAGLVADRRALTGQILPPALPATAIAWRAGRLDGAHLDAITGFLHDLPAETLLDKRESAEVFLHHKLLETGWKTRKLPNGDTEWIPPPQLGIVGGVSAYHHPERFLPEE